MYRCAAQRISSPAYLIPRQTSFGPNYGCKLSPLSTTQDPTWLLSRDIGGVLSYCARCLSTRSNLPRAHVILRNEVKALSGIFRRSGFSFLDQAKLLGITDHKRLFNNSVINKQQQQQQQEQEGDDKKKQEDEERPPMVPRFVVWFWLAFTFFTLSRLLQGEDNSAFKYVSWNEFMYEMLLKGEVAEVVVRPDMEVAIIKLQPGAVVKGRRVDSHVFALKIPDSYNFEEKVRQVEEDVGVKRGEGVSITYHRQSSWVSVVFLAVVLFGLYLVGRKVKFQMPNPTEMFSSQSKAKFTRGDIIKPDGKAVTFRDVAGLHEAKVEVMEFVDYLKHPDRYKTLGAKIPHGALLLGPPGCGKTLLAKAVASEAGVPFLVMAGSEFVEMLGGLGAARVRDLFAEARKRAPCIVYIDEIDAIGRKRSGSNVSETGGGAEEEHTLNQMLVEMDGMGTQEGVIVLASTNRSEVLDKALLRPGRFDRHILIDLPTLAERKETFEMYLAQMKTSRPPQVYSDKLSKLTPGMSGADIANICNEAGLHAARDTKRSIDWQDFEYAVERVIAGVAKKTSVLTAQEKNVVAYHEAGHALVGWLLKHTDALLRVSIVPRTSSALGFAQYMPADHKLHSKEEIFEKMCMALGGRAAEALTFNRVTTGAQDDLKRVTQLAYDQIRSFGMSDVVGLLSFPATVEQESQFGMKPYSKKLAHTIDDEARALVGRAYKNAEHVLKENADKLSLLAETLLQKEVLTYEDVEQLIGPPPHGKKEVIDTTDLGYLMGERKEDNANGPKNDSSNSQ